VIDFPEVNLTPVVAGYLKLGQAVQAANTPLDGMVRITEGDEHKFIGMGEIDSDGRVAPRRLVVEFPV
ncbi:tRNA pseudouridine(55) synthase TruB, partial [Pectobacterium peruviense]